MSNAASLYQILDFILNHATQGELQVITEALRRRRASRPGGPPGEGLNLQGMARNMAQRVQEQLASINIEAVSRKILSDLIRQKEPGINDEQLEALLRAWLPGKQPAQSDRGERKPAPDQLICEIARYLEYRNNRMPPEEREGLPAGWAESCWQSFPPSCRQAILDHLEGRLAENAFWESVLREIEQEY